MALCDRRSCDGAGECDVCEYERLIRGAEFDDMGDFHSPSPIPLRLAVLVALVTAFVVFLVAYVLWNLVRLS